jgi:hypothetical protein
MSEGGPHSQQLAGSPAARAGASAAQPPEPRAARGLRLIETTVLLALALLLAIATVNDVLRQTHINHRLVADLRTWRTYTGHDYHNLTVAQDLRSHTTHEVVCGNTMPGEPKARVQLCLAISGSVRHGRRAVQGGWYLPSGAEDVPRYRYGCFGQAALQHTCPKS